MYIATPSRKILVHFQNTRFQLYFPLYGYFGGWDDHNIEIFNEAVRISGPSKFLFNPILKANKLLLKKSSFHNKFEIPWRDGKRGAEELMKEAFINEHLAQNR